MVGGGGDPFEKESGGQGTADLGRCCSAIGGRGGGGVSLDEFPQPGQIESFCDVRLPGKTIKDGESSGQTGRHALEEVGRLEAAAAA